MNLIYVGILQFQPNRWRKEGANVGVVVTDGEKSLVRVTSSSFHVEKMFGIEVDENRFMMNVLSAGESLKDNIRTRSDIELFSKLNNGDIYLRPSHNLLSEETETLDFVARRMFLELVEDEDARKTSKEAICPLCGTVVVYDHKFPIVRNSEGAILCHQHSEEQEPGYEKLVKDFLEMKERNKCLVEKLHKSLDEEKILVEEICL